MEFDGYKYDTIEAVTDALRTIDIQLGIYNWDNGVSKIISSYTDYIEIDGDYYILADDRIIPILGSPTRYEFEDETN